MFLTYMNISVLFILQNLSQHFNTGYVHKMTLTEIKTKSRQNPGVLSTHLSSLKGIEGTRVCTSRRGH